MCNEYTYVLYNSSFTRHGFYRTTPRHRPIRHANRRQPARAPRRRNERPHGSRRRGREREREREGRVRAPDWRRRCRVASSTAPMSRPGSWRRSRTTLRLRQGPELQYCMYVRLGRSGILRRRERPDRGARAIGLYYRAASPLPQAPTSRPTGRDDGARGLLDELRAGGPVAGDVRRWGVEGGEAVSVGGRGCWALLCGQRAGEIPIRGRGTLAG